MNKRGNIFIILAIIATLAFGATYYYNLSVSKQNTNFKTKESFKTYSSQSMGINIDVNQKFTINDQSSRILLSNTDGEVIISRAGTQFNDLDSYLKDFDLKNHTQILSEEDLKIDSLHTKKRKVSIDGNLNESYYKIFTGTRVYTLSTSSEALYDDLDQIAKSFKYIP